MHMTFLTPFFGFDSTDIVDIRHILGHVSRLWFDYWRLSQESVSSRAEYWFHKYGSSWAVLKPSYVIKLIQTYIALDSLNIPPQYRTIL